MGWKVCRLPITEASRCAQIQEEFEAMWMAREAGPDGAAMLFRSDLGDDIEIYLTPIAVETYPNILRLAEWQDCEPPKRNTVGFGVGHASQLDAIFAASEISH